MRMHMGLGFLMVGGLLLAACGDESQTPGTGPAVGASVPSKDVLVAELHDVLAALETGDPDKALEHFAFPSGMSTESARSGVGTFIEKREISAAGIDRLVAEGRFGSLAEVFPERGAAWAKRAGVELASCYALALDGAEVAAVWDGATFRIIRLDDVGKL